MAKAKKKKTKSTQQPAQPPRLLSVLLLMGLCFAGGFAASLKLQGVDPLAFGKQKAAPVQQQPASPPTATNDGQPGEQRTLETPPPVAQRPQPEVRPEPTVRDESQTSLAATKEQNPPTEKPRSKPEAQPAPAPSPIAMAPAPRPTPAAGTSGRVAIIIDDCGNSPNRGFVELPVPITLAVLPHVAYAKAVANQAASAGKDVILHLPMEASGDSDPGPGTLKIEMSDQDLRHQVADNFAAVPGIIGVNNHQGSKASADRRVMQEVIAETARRGLFYLDSRTTSATVAPQLAPAAGVPLLSRDVFLDNVDEVDAVLAQLRAAEEVARRQGTALAIGHPRPNTLKALQTWIPQAQAGGFQLVRLSDILAEEKTYAQAP